MASTPSECLLSFGTETEQFYINRFRVGYWLTRIDRVNRVSTKIGIRREDYLLIKDSFISKIEEVIQSREGKSDQYIKTSRDVHFRHM